ncbi:hypothetical protein U9M48_037418 [Paspalum notatum var. saurae]|uniref:F-box domain-containing protein n=1 Tax=Paspalum notatum var. saurae TaxID=547442 RepID=A0AAQ3UFJ8_PASNO
MASDLPVDLLEEILLRLDDAADLVRASAACATFRGIVSDGRFRRRFRSLHRPPVLGLLGHRTGGLDYFYPAEPPHRSTPTARALARATDFSFSFLDEPIGAWQVSDVCDGRVPPIPADPVEAVLQQLFEPFLLPAAASGKKDEGDDDDPSSFQLLCIVASINMSDQVPRRSATTFFYSSLTGEWRAVVTLNKNNIAPYHDPVTWMLSGRHYAHGCFYWPFGVKRAMLKLDTHEMKFSIVDLPVESECRNKIIIVEVADQDRVGILILSDQHNLDLYSINKTCWRGGKSDNAMGGTRNNDWRHDNGIPLLLGYQQWSLYGVAGGYALLRGVPEDEHHKPMTIARCFTVDIKTFLIEQLCELEISIKPVLPRRLSHGQGIEVLPRRAAPHRPLTPSPEPPTSPSTCLANLRRLWRPCPPLPPPPPPALQQQAHLRQGPDVYDPLYRQHVKVPPIPDDLVACPPPLAHGAIQHFEPFLLPATAHGEKDNDDGGNDDTPLQLMRNVVSVNAQHRSATTFSYSSVARKWRTVATAPNDARYHHPFTWTHSKRYYAHDCFFWMFVDERPMLMLDTHDMKFSIVNLPTGMDRQRTQDYCGGS